MRAFDVLEWLPARLGVRFRTICMLHPCLSCGACCAYFRVAFHWSEADASLDGVVPPELTETLDPHRLVMRGTQASQPRCVALQGTVGTAAHCGIYERRPSVCREVEPSWEFGRPSAQCDKARLGHGLPPLTPEHWPLTMSGD
jgi:Fe-S-cluster containining protein